MPFYDQRGFQSPQPAARSVDTPDAHGLPHRDGAGGGSTYNERMHPDIMVQDLIERAEAVVGLAREWLNSGRFPVQVDAGPEGVSEYTLHREDIERRILAYHEARDALQHECPELATLARLRAQHPELGGELDALEDCVFNAREV